MSIFSDKLNSNKLKKAWALDQRALFDKDKKRQKKLWSESVKIYKELLKKYKTRSSDRLQILMKLATINQHQGKFAQSKKYLDTANREVPRDPIIAFNCGNLYRAMNKPGKAISYYKRAIKLNDKLSSGRQLFSKELKKYEKTLRKS